MEWKFSNLTQYGCNKEDILKSYEKDKNLLENYLKYELLYNHRNRCAHNTQSYQQNLPTLEILQNKNYIYENYFIRFAVLILIDQIFILLYDKYLILQDDFI